MQHVFYCPIYGTAPCAYNRMFSVFLLNKLRFVSGSSQCSAAVKLFNQGNKL